MFNGTDTPSQDSRSQHAKSDVDFDDKSQHHTLGEGPYQAAKGSAVSKLRSDLLTLQQSLGTLETDLGTISTDVDTIETNLGVVANDLQTAQSDISNLVSGLGDANDRLDTAEGNILSQGLSIFAYGQRLDFLEAERIPQPRGGSALLASPMYGGQGITVSAGLSSLWLTPIILTRTITVQRLWIEVTTAVASSNARVGIYGSNADGMPVGAPIASGSLAATTTGMKSLLVATAFNPGVYYIGAKVETGTSTYRCNPPTPDVALLGMSSAGVPNNRLTVPGGSAGSMPNVTSTGFAFDAAAAHGGLKTLVEVV